MATDAGLLILRLVVGLIFAAHGAQKAFGWWSGPGLDGWTGAMNRMGYRPPPFWAVVSTAAELVGGLCLALGLLTPIAAAVLLAQSIAIIGTIHLPKGFWNTQGGFEFPLSLAGGAVAIGLAGPGAYSVDASIGLTYDATLAAVLLGIGLIAGLVAFAWPQLSGSRDQPVS